MGIKIVIVTFFALGFCHITQAQTSLTSAVLDADQKPMSGINIILRDSLQIVAYTNTDLSGKFFFNSIANGTYKLEIIAPGYEKTEFIVTVLEATSNLPKSIILSQKILKLAEVIIESKNPITVKGDTIIIDAASFTNGKEKVVEDILKKLPGITVTPEGRIMIGNKEVEKVMIEGDDFFEKGYTMLTKNMPANPIDKINIINRYSKNKLLKGIEESEKVALNLTLKNDYKRVWFGNIEAGSNFLKEHRYDAKNNNMNFGKLNKYYILSNLNNIGYETLNNFKSLINTAEGTDHMGVDKITESVKLTQLTATLPQFNRDRVIDNNSKLFNVNSIFSLNKVTKLKVTVLIDTEQQDVFRSSQTSFFGIDSSFENLQTSRSERRTETGFLKLFLSTDIDQTSTLSILSQVGTRKINNLANFNFNGNLIDARQPAENFFNENQLFFTKKINAKAVLTVKTKLKLESFNDNYTANDFPYKNFISTFSDSMRQSAKTSLRYWGIDADYYLRTSSKNLAHFKMGTDISTSSFTSNIDVFNSGSIVAEPNELINNANLKINTSYLLADYTLKKNKYIFKPSVTITNIQNEIYRSGSLRKSTYTFVSPSLSLNYLMSKKSKFFGIYNHNQRNNIAVDDLLLNYTQVGFQSLSSGVDNVAPIATNSFTGGYAHGNWGDKIFVNSFFTRSSNTNYLGNELIVRLNFLISQKAILPKFTTSAFAASCDVYLKKMKNNLKASFNFTQNSYQDILNGSAVRQIVSATLTPGLQLRSGFKGVFNYTLASELNYTTIKNFAGSNNIRSKTIVDLDFLISNKLNLHFNGENHTVQKQKSYQFINAEINYELRKNKWNLSLIGDNLSNSKNLNLVELGSFSNSLISYRLRPRFVVAKLGFRF